MNVSVSRIFARILRSAALFLAVAATATAGQAQGNDPDGWEFDKQAYHPDGTPWTGPVNVGDVIKYVLSYKPGSSPSGPVTIDDILSPNQSYLAPTQGPGWTWGTAPYSVGNHEQYSTPGFGPATGSVKLTIQGNSVATPGVGDGTVPVPVPGANRVFGVFHHAASSAVAKVDCWDITTLAKCATAKPNGVSGFLNTPVTPQSVVRGTRFYFPGYRSTDNRATFGCFDGAANAACADTPVSAVVGNMGDVGGIVEDASGRMFMAVKDKLFCMAESGGSLSPCSGWPATGYASISSAQTLAYNSNVVYLLPGTAPLGDRVYIHHGTATVQCIDTAAMAPCSGWPVAGVHFAGKTNGIMLSSLPASGTSGDGGVCLWQLAGAQVGCVDASGNVISVTPASLGVVAISSFRIPGTSNIIIPQYSSSGPKCLAFNGTTGSACGAPFPIALPASGTQYGFALDPTKPPTCVFSLGHANLLWRFDYVTGEIGCGTTKATTPPIEDIYCHDAPAANQFQWTNLTVATTGAAGTLTIKQGTITATVAVISGTTNYPMPPLIATGSGPLTFTYAPASGSPVSIDFEVFFDAPTAPPICYQAEVTDCGPVFNDAVMKGGDGAAEGETSRRVDLGIIAQGPDCQPKPEEVSCLTSIAEVSCGKTPGTYVISLKPSGTGGFNPTSVELTSLTPGVTIVNPLASYPVVGGVVQVTVTGANPGDTIEFDVAGTEQGQGPVEGADICCNGKVTVTIPKEMDCDPETLIDLAIKKTGETKANPFDNGYVFDLTVANLGAAISGTNSIIVYDSVPAGMTFNSAVGTDWSCATLPSLGTLPAPAGTTIACTYTGGGTVVQGQVLSPISITALADGEGPYSTVENCTRVATLPGALGSDQNLPNNDSCVTLTKDAEPEIDIEKFCGPVTDTHPSHNGISILGEWTAFCRIIVTTSGPQTGTLTVNDSLLGGAGVVDVIALSTPAWACVGASCSIAGSLLNQTASTSVLEALVTFPDSGAATESQNCATVSDGAAPDAEDCADFPNNPTPSTLTVIKTCEPAAEVDGVIVHYEIDCQITVTTTGPQSGTVSVTDLPSGTGAVTSITSTTTPAWACTIMGCTINGSALNQVSSTSTMDVAMSFGTMAEVVEGDNCAILAVDGNQTDQSCVPFTINDDSIGNLSVTKEAVFGGEPIVGAVFPFNITCGGVSMDENIASGGTWTSPMMPYGLTCTVTEGALPITGLCPVGQAEAWVTTYSPSQTAFINSPTQTITVQNILSCIGGATPSTLTVTKTCEPATEVIGAINHYEIDCQITVTSTGPQSGIVSVGEQPFGVGAIMSIGTTTTPPWACTINGCAILGSALNQASSTSSIDVTISYNTLAEVAAGSNCASVAVDDVVQDQLCVPYTVAETMPEAPDCDSATTRATGQTCECRFDNMSAISETACGCDAGYELKAGKGCEKVKDLPKCDGRTAKLVGETCRCTIKDTVPVSATSCGCAKGKELVGGKCVAAKPQCERGFKFNTKRNRCEPVCPKGTQYDSKRNQCIKAQPECPAGTSLDKKTGKCQPISKSTCPRGQVQLPGTNFCVGVRAEKDDKSRPGVGGSGGAIP